MQAVRMRLIGIAVGVVLACAVVVALRPPISQPSLAHQLVRMARDDQDVRTVRIGVTDLPQLTKDHLAEMKLIVARYGWPDEKKVGPEGAHAAWIVTMNLKNDVAFQARALSLMEKSDHVRALDVAFLDDKVAVATHKPQRYGTQVSCTGGVLDLSPTVGQPALDQNRRSVGLPPIGRGRPAFRVRGPGPCANTGPATTIPSPPVATDTP